MGKTIKISMNANPTEGFAFGYNIYLENKLLVVAGENSTKINYVSTGEDTYPNNVLIRANLKETLEATVGFLRKNYYHNIITYRLIDNSIEIIISGENVIIQLVNSDNFASGLRFSVSENNNTKAYLLNYFLEYDNVINDRYRCEIYKLNYTEEPKEIAGSIILEKSSAKDHLEVIRGSGITLDLEANENLTFDDLYSESEQAFMVKVYKNSKIFFIGYLKPDGIFQSYSDSVWKLQIDCIDGLGALKDLAFVDEKGFRFYDKMYASNVIFYCLKRTGLDLNINTSVNIFFKDSYITETVDIFRTINVNADRFFKTDDETIMSCDEVLTSILDLFSACITQQDGEWYIYKPNELFYNKITRFKRYDLDNNFISLVDINLNKVLGSHIDGYYPHHCNANQKIETKGAISAYRIGYKYGYITSLLDNPNLKRTGLNYNGWVINRPEFFLDDPSQPTGLIFQNKFGDISYNLANMNPLQVYSGSVFSLFLSVTTYSDCRIYLKIKIGDYYLIHKENYYNLISLEEGLQTTSWQQNYIMENTQSTKVDYWRLDFNNQIDLEIKMPPIPVSGNLEITINRIGTFTGRGVTTIKSLDLRPISGSSVGIGEFHTVSRGNKISSIVKANKQVFNGDNNDLIYLGAIFKAGGGITSSWFRKGYYEEKPLLRIAAEEELRISQKALQLFSGDIYGFFPYLCVIEINKLNRSFMFIEYSYNTLTNITSGKLLELFCKELPDLQYDFSLDKGQTVKPTIIG